MKPVSVERYQSTTWWLLFPLAIALAYMGEVTNLPITLISTIFCSWALLPIKQTRWSKLAARGWIQFTAFAVLWGLGAVEYRATEDVFYLIGGFLSGVMPLSIHFRKNRTGYWSSLFACLLMGLAGVIGGGELREYIGYLFFLGVLLFSLNADNLSQSAGQSVTQDRKLPKGYFKQFIFSLGWGLGGVALIFFLFPRGNLWTSPVSLRGKEKKLGYSDKITLDGQSFSGEMETVAFTVKVKGQRDVGKRVSWLKENSRSLFFRGSSVDTFDGKSWKNSIEDFYPYHASVDLRTSQSHSPRATVMEIYREPSTNVAIFYPDILSSLLAPRRLMGGIFFNTAGSLKRGRDHLLRYSYEITVSEPKLTPVILQTQLGKIREGIEKSISRKGLAHRMRRVDLKRYLQVPDSVGSADYFQKWKASVGNVTPEWDVGRIFGALRLEFSENFKPTLLSSHNPDRAFESFITTNKKGHCEYFSTATVMFLRTLGIPARVVLGYLGGDYNPVSDTLEVREGHAHAWVEVYLPRSGWLRFDPTPTVVGLAQDDWKRQFRFYYYAAKFWFNTYVVDYNGETQRGLATSFRRLTEKQNWDLTVSWKFVGRAILGFGLVALLLFGVRQWVRRARKQKKPGLPNYYERFLKSLKLAGYQRSAGESFRAFHERLKKDGFEHGILDEITHLLERELYGRRHISPMELKSIQSSLQEVLQRVRERKKAA